MKQLDRQQGEQHRVELQPADLRFAKSGIVPSLARGEDRREFNRPGYTDWRVNPRSYDFIGAVFDPLTPMQTLARAKWMTVNHGFRFLVTPNVDHLVRVAKEPEVFNPLYEASWLSVCDSRILELLANFSGIPLKAVPGSDLTQQLFDNVITSSKRNMASQKSIIMSRLLDSAINQMKWQKRRSSLRIIQRVTSLFASAARSRKWLRKHA